MYSCLECLKFNSGGYADGAKPFCAGKHKHFTEEDNYTKDIPFWCEGPSFISDGWVKPPTCYGCYYCIPKTIYNDSKYICERVDKDLEYRNVHESSRFLPNFCPGADYSKKLRKFYKVKDQGCWCCLYFRNPENAEKNLGVKMPHGFCDVANRMLESGEGKPISPKWCPKHGNENKYEDIDFIKWYENRR